jgi:hypothetical protein
VVSVPLPPEDELRAVDLLIGVICEEMGFTMQRQIPQPAESTQTTSKRWYYLQPEASAQAQALSLSTDAIPDLVLEGDRTNPVAAPFDQYLALGVPEIWCIEGKALHFYQLENGTYVERDRSTVFPFVPVTEIPMFLEKIQKVGEETVAKAFRAWSRMRIRENRGQTNPPPPPPPLPPLNPFG